MRYLTDKKTKEVKVRLNWAVYEALKGISSVEEKSLNFLINDLLKEALKARKSESRKEVSFNEKPNLVFSKENVKIYNNDFLKVDLSEYRRKVNLLVTSPPYNLSVEYGKYDDSLDYKDYLSFTEEWLKKAYELMADDGRICVNIPLDKNKNGLKPVYADFVEIAKKVGFKYQSTIVWNEQNISRRTAWGSWLSASAPYVIAPVEMIVVMYKNQWKRINKGKSTIEREEFIEWTNGVWTFSGESKKRVGHPAPFPLELPKRCIRLFSYEGDLVLDPFLGSGTTLVAALREGRRAVGVEIDKSYVNLAVKRLEKEIKQLLNSSQLLF